MNIITEKVADFLVGIAARLATGKLFNVSYNAAFNIDENTSIGIADGHYQRLKNCIATSMYCIADYAKKHSYGGSIIATATLYDIYFEAVKMCAEEKIFEIPLVTNWTPGYVKPMLKKVPILIQLENPDIIMYVGSFDEKDNCFISCDCQNKIPVCNVKRWCYILPEWTPPRFKKEE